MTAAVDTVLGRSIPPDTPHAVSVSLPTWSANVGYEEGEDWVISKLTTGYPRFFIQKPISIFADLLLRNHGTPGESIMLFPSQRSANSCADFFKSQCQDIHEAQARTIIFVPAVDQIANPRIVWTLKLAAFFFPSNLSRLAKTFWQHTGEGISGRQAGYCCKLYEEGLLLEQHALGRFEIACKGPKRYQKSDSKDDKHTVEETDLQRIENGNSSFEESLDHAKFVEERFGRNLHLDLADSAKSAIRRRVSGSLIANVDLEQAEATSENAAEARYVPGLTSDDVYLYPGGMSSIFNTHQTMMSAFGQERKSICFGFPYIDTLKVLEKFGPGCLFYGNGIKEDLDDLEKRLQDGQRFLALFCEFPSNPLLRTPDVQRIRALGDKYDFAVVIDETVGNYLNVNTLEYADVLVSSLTKIFSGDSNVMGGCAILNPQRKFYGILKQSWDETYEDCYWPEDAIYMERNSRDFASRTGRINDNAEAICSILERHSKVKRVYYPKVNDSKTFYDSCRARNGGYGGLLSATFYSLYDATLFYDNLTIEKGPSLGTNFTLASPFVILAHYKELEWAAKYGVEAALVRFSVGLEDTNELLKTFASALAVLE